MYCSQLFFPKGPVIIYVESGGGGGGGKKGGQGYFRLAIGGAKLFYKDVQGGQQIDRDVNRGQDG